VYLKRLLLRNFRNYAHAEVVFSPLINLIQGENGQGKTNLLEAIHFISTGRSFRASNLSDLISFGESFFYLEAEFYKDGITQFIKVYYDETTRKVQYNETVHSTLTSLLGILPSTLLSPDDLSLVSGSPAERRRFLDIHIAQTDPLYLHHLGRYFKAMKQRNQLLRMKSDAAIEAWEQMMAQSASYIALKRRGFIEALKTPISKWVEILSRGLDAVEIHYQPSLAFASKEGDLTPHFQKVWQKNRSKEMLLGLTQTGPHRDDLAIQSAGKSAKGFSSEGQKRSYVSALRFAEWEQMAGILETPPLLGIDDFGIQLDQERQMQLKTHLLKFNQVFLTSPAALEKDFTAPRILTIAGGTVS
jgi:DNA replication and repair protein RecF